MKYWQEKACRFTDRNSEASRSLQVTESIVDIGVGMLLTAMLNRKHRSLPWLKEDPNALSLMTNELATRSSSA